MQCICSLLCSIAATYLVEASDSPLFTVTQISNNLLNHIESDTFLTDENTNIVKNYQRLVPHRDREKILGPLTVNESLSAPVKHQNSKLDHEGLNILKTTNNVTTLATPTSLIPTSMLPITIFAPLKIDTAQRTNASVKDVKVVQRRGRHSAKLVETIPNAHNIVMAAQNVAEKSVYSRKQVVGRPVARIFQKYTDRSVVHAARRGALRGNLYVVMSIQPPVSKQDKARKIWDYEVLKSKNINHIFFKPSPIYSLKNDVLYSPHPYLFDTYNAYSLLAPNPPLSIRPISFQLPDAISLNSDNLHNVHRGSRQQQILFNSDQHATSQTIIGAALPLPNKYTIAGQAKSRPNFTGISNKEDLRWEYGFKPPLIPSTKI